MDEQKKNYANSISDNIEETAKNNYYACIVGKAYYEGKVDLKEAIACLQKE